MVYCQIYPAQARIQIQGVTLGTAMMIVSLRKRVGKKRSKHKKKSGLNAKASDNVRHPQKKPHAHEHKNK